MKMNALDAVAYILVIVGGLNWGLIGFFDYNLVGEIFGFGSTASRVIYGAVGVASLYAIYTMFKMMGKSK
ncbi:MAG TPA: DUF378 domain-containing protein [Patescibacteria group bacterium]|jgi:uncharacterized membrane protein YuzA (DUF378 family)|nr:DUF378 domain-containing protein [Patescibacteria group bacterium]